MVEALATNWLVVFIFMLVGGVASVITIYQLAVQRTRFKFNVAMLYQAQDGGSGALVVFLLGTVINPGKSPLAPQSFDLDAKFDGKKYRFDRVLIPSGLKFGPGVALPPDLATKDLRRYKGAFVENQPVYGALEFGSTTAGFDAFSAARRNRTLKLTLHCTDEQGRTRSARLKLPVTEYDHPAGKGRVEFPKHDVTATRNPGA